MKKVKLAIAAGFVASSLGAVAVVEAGNGAPQGPHEYQLNIIGTSDKSADMDDNNGRRIFVPLRDKKAAIYLQEGPYAVIDANGTDGEATFQLPAPGYDAHLVGDPGDADVTSNYSVFIRPLGKPGGWATITTCAELVDSTFAGLLPGSFLRTLNRDGLVPGTECSIEQVDEEILTRRKGKSLFTNVTAELTSVVFDVVYLDGDGNQQTVQIRVPLFSDIMDG